MDDLELVLEKFETPDHASCDTSENILRDSSALELVKTSGVHVLHTIIDTGFYEESTVKLDNFGCDSTM